jgi:hypothetical protein
MRMLLMVRDALAVARPPHHEVLVITGLDPVINALSSIGA